MMRFMGKIVSGMLGQQTRMASLKLHGFTGGRIKHLGNPMAVSLTPGFSRVVATGARVNGFNRFPCRQHSDPGQAVETALAIRIPSPPG
jgi:hypothetical protein